jgi:hypothetical protein
VSVEEGLTDRDPEEDPLPELLREAEKQPEPVGEAVPEREDEAEPEALTQTLPLVEGTGLQLELPEGEKVQQPEAEALPVPQALLCSELLPLPEAAAEGEALLQEETDALTDTELQALPLHVEQPDSEELPLGLSVELTDWVGEPETLEDALSPGLLEGRPEEEAEELACQDPVVLAQGDAETEAEPEEEGVLSPEALGCMEGLPQLVLELDTEAEGQPVPEVLPEGRGV